MSLIEKLLPNEMLLLVFAKLSKPSLGAAQLVCRQWKVVGDTPSIWRTACLEAFSNCTLETNERLLYKFHRGSWKDMYLDRCHLNFNGVYVSRNTYLKQGATEWKVRNPVHLVAYYRYVKFFPDGTFLYRTTPETVSKVAKTMEVKGGSHTSRKQDHSGVQSGRYKLDGDKLYTALRYANSTSTEVRSRMKVRSTVRGAFNRLDIESIVSYDRADGSSVPMTAAPAEDEDEEIDGVERKRYSRGLAPYVFVPWESVQTHVLNLPVEQMDVFIAG